MADEKNLGFIYDPIVKKIKESSMLPIQFNTYIEPLKPIDVDGKYIILQCPSEQMANFITTRLSEHLENAIIEADTGFKDFKLVVEDSLIYTYAAPNEEEAFEQPKNLLSGYTFDKYVVGKNNEFAYAAALNIAKAPLNSEFNPLFIHGGAGLGKTHLIQAIAHYILDNQPTLKIIYTTCEQFVNEIIDTMFTHRDNDTRERANKLKAHYRSCDVLIIDDIQFIEGKKAVQEEFFHTFNQLVANGKQVVISSDRPPKELSTLEDRLKTRFVAGLILNILPPNYETKIAILRKKSFEKRCNVPDDVIDYLASLPGDDVRTLEGRLNKVIFAAGLYDEAEITVDFAKSALNEAVPDSNEEITASAVIKAVANFYHISEEDLRGKCKKKEIVIPRQICCYLMLDLLSMPLTKVGHEMGGRDHTTVMHARNKIADMIRLNDRIAKEVDDIKNIIQKK